MGYAIDREIDLNSLEIELAKQPLLFDKYSELYAHAVKERDKLSEKLKVIKAEADKDIRQEAVINGTKLTEAKISNMVILNEKVQGAEQELIEAIERVNLLSGAKEAFYHKKSALGNLVDLYCANYFTANTENIGKQKLKVGEKELQEGFTERMNRRKRSRED